MPLNNRYLKEKLKDKKYIDKLIEKYEYYSSKEKEYKDKIIKFNRKFYNLSKIYSQKKEINDLIKKYNLYEKVDKNDYLTVTSRGEIPPTLDFIKEEKRLIYPWVVSVQNLGYLDYHHESIQYLRVIEKIIERFMRKRDNRRIVSIDELVTASSLEFRIYLMKDISYIENEMKKRKKSIKIIPDSYFINFSSRYYYGEKLDSCPHITYNYLKKRKKNLERIKKEIREIKELTGANIDYEIIELKEPVIWQDNSEFYSKVIATYLPFPKLFHEKIMLNFRNFYGKKESINKLLNFYEELSKIHTNIIRDELNKVSKNSFYGLNGLYIIKNVDFSKSEFKDINKFIEDYELKSLNATKKLFEKYGYKNLGLEKKGNKYFLLNKNKKILAEWDDLRLENQKEDGIKSGLRLLLSVKEE